MVARPKQPIHNRVTVRSIFSIDTLFCDSFYIQKHTPISKLIAQLHIPYCVCRHLLGTQRNHDQCCCNLVWAILCAYFRAYLKYGAGTEYGIRNAFYSAEWLLRSDYCPTSLCGAGTHLAATYKEGYYYTGPGGDAGELNSN